MYRGPEATTMDGVSAIFVVFTYLPVVYLTSNNNENDYYTPDNATSNIAMLHVSTDNKY